MDGIQQVALPILGIVAAAAATFYAVSFSELREVAFSSSVLTKKHNSLRYFTDFFWTCRNHLMIWRTLRLKMEDSSMWAQGRDGQEKKQRNKSKVEHRQQSSWLLLYEYFLLLSLGERCNRFYSLVCNMLFIGVVTIMIYRKSLSLCFTY